MNILGITDVDKIKESTNFEPTFTLLHRHGGLLGLRCSPFSSRS